MKNKIASEVRIKFKFCTGTDVMTFLFTIIRMKMCTFLTDIFLPKIYQHLSENKNFNILKKAKGILKSYRCGSYGR